MNRPLLAALCAIAAVAITATAATWMPDATGAPDDNVYATEGFEMTRVYANPADTAASRRCTVVRRLAADTAARRAVLYVHGFNDYFFQRFMADTFALHGYNFYAVDLPGYGRSLRPSDIPYYTRSIPDYFADIDSAVAIIKAAGDTTVALIGHSTGGLVTACYMAQGHPSPLIRALVLNSPFLDWNLGRKEWLIPAISFIGGIFPKLKIPQDGSTAYGESLLAGAHGEWQFNTNTKQLKSPTVRAGWIRAITKAQKSLRKADYPIQVPVLLMYSARSVYGTDWTAEHSRGDAVLDVADIQRYGARLSRRVTEIEVEGGLHDLVLSQPQVRDSVLADMLAWLKINLPSPSGSKH